MCRHPQDLGRRLSSIQRRSVAAQKERAEMGAKPIRVYRQAEARREWEWVAASPTTNVRRPRDAESRDHRISQDKIDRFTLASGFDECPVTKVKQRVGVAFLFAIETAIPAGEICGLKPTSIDGPVATLYNTKNGTRRRVPLSKRAIELLSFLPKSSDSDSP